jgi:tetratricopeptide (TPR) repeat protein
VVSAAADNEAVLVMVSDPSREPVAADDDGNTFAALRQQGLQQLQAGRFADAIELFGRARVLNPADAQTQLNLGIALQGAKRHAEALDHFGQLQRSLPNAPAPFLHATASLLALGKADAAVAAASDARRLAPQLPQALYTHGLALLAAKKPAEAEQAFAAALERAPAWADAWVNCGAARYRQGAIEGAKAATQEALRHAPNHPAATANLQALMRVSSKTEATAAAQADPGKPHNASSSPDAQHASDSDQKASAGGDAKLSTWIPDNPVISLGLAVEYLRKKPAFARLPFGEWSQVLVGQINRGHFCFVINEQRQIRGFFGWALTSERLAEEWVENRSGLRDEDCRGGDCVIFNAWAAESFRAHRFMVDTGRKVIEGKRTLYFKRHYRDGRTRPVRLAATDFVANHLARAVARDGDPGSDPSSGQRDDDVVGDLQSTVGRQS